MGGRVSRLKPAKSILDAAKRLDDPAECADLLERSLDKVDKPALLVPALVEAFEASPLDPEVVAEKWMTWCRARSRDFAFLDAVGRALDDGFREEDAIEVLRIAVAAGSTYKHTLETLGRLLVLRGDAEGVPFLERACKRDPEWSPPRIALATWFHDKEPDRALAILEEVDTARARDLRSMIHRDAGRDAEAARAELEALECYDNDIVGRKSLSTWHYNENRFERALHHAKALLEMRQNRPEEAFQYFSLDDLDETIAQAFRLGGAFDELVGWLRERVAKYGMTGDLGWQTFHALTAFSPTRELDLAIQAGEAAMRRDLEKHQVHSARRWRVLIARERAAAGQIDALEALAREGLDDDAGAWVELADAYQHVELYDAAHAAVDRALQLDPSSAEAMSTLFDLSLAAGDSGALHRWAEALAAAKPRWHQGWEHLGRSYARLGDAGAARQHARRATQMAPFCHNAWTGLAEAYIVAGELAHAREAALRSIHLEAPELGDDISILRAAIEGNPDALERALAARYPHLPAPPFPAFIEKLREVARRATPTS